MLEIEALDTLFFRDGKSFAKGEDTWANSNFPPSPAVFYGALRSVYFSNHMESFAKAQLPDDPTAALIINGLFMKLGQDICFPMPLDCVTPKKSRNSKACLLSLIKNDGVNSSPMSFLLQPKNQEEVEQDLEGYLDSATFKEYLNSGAEEFYYKKLSDYIHNEPKIGITRSKQTHSSQEHMLYRVDMRRMDKASFVVGYTGISLPQEGFIKLGGEGKGAIYKPISMRPIPAPQRESKRFKLYLATPAIYGKGWIPQWMDQNTLEGVYQGIHVKMLAAAVGRPVFIGGFDMKQKRPKPMQKAVSAGSVYYFEIIEGQWEEVIQSFHGKNISDNLAKQGFGLAYMGEIR
ncbi:hypothetical protein AT727_08870 [Desulfitobacterium hafniense]|uniref:Type III-B CRISPR module-associated protein Cmr3 n=1 Tax=Desulfitobacterium hafniense TaxID=49338 RepID=A0A0W1JF37_DESHA|nr:type III-B CRISPR module-associated protein Cmr3 [Desulfitobacterium hafniense]KTE90030.1 hypothetical protein AT727_08870 [Desulfitobacterium hafniense]